MAYLGPKVCWVPGLVAPLITLELPDNSERSCVEAPSKNGSQFSKKKVRAKYTRAKILIMKGKRVKDNSR